MNHQGKRLMFFLIQLFSDIQAKKFVVKKWRSFLQFFYQRNFMPTFFLPIKYVTYPKHISKIFAINMYLNEKYLEHEG